MQANIKANIGAAALIAGLAIGAVGCGDGENPTVYTQEQPAVMALTKGSAKVGALIAGHWEGSPGGHGEVCVTIGTDTDCHAFSTTSGETMVVIPPSQTQAASVTVRISDETGDLVLAVDQFSDTGEKCENMPVLDVTGFTPCAHPDYLEGPVKRFNLMINSSAGGPFDKRRGNPDDPTG